MKQACLLDERTEIRLGAAQKIDWDNNNTHSLNSLFLGLGAPVSVFDIPIFSSKSNKYNLLIQYLNNNTYGYYRHYRFIGL